MAAKETIHYRLTGRRLQLRVSKKFIDMLKVFVENKGVRFYRNCGAVVGEYNEVIKYYQLS